jgi:hypothetical protein
MRILYSTHTRPTEMPPLSMSPEQIVVGPHYPDEEQADGIRSLTLPKGPFDAGALIDRLPSRQKPDMLVALVDSFRVCVPVNLSSVKIPKHLIIGDTHHGQHPLTTMLGYLREERFDRLIVTYDPHHLHWFAEARIAPAAYIAAINVHDHPQAFNEDRRRAIVFIGQAGRFHPRRVRLLQAIQSAGLPLVVERRPPERAAAAYNQHQIVFNCSLNGDLNMRVFEVLGAGGFLVTDRLSPQSGMQRLLRPGIDYLDYSGPDDLVALLRRYLDRPQACLEIARAGHASYLRDHRSEVRIRRFFDFASSQRAPEECWDPRALPGSEGFGQALDERVRVYEILQRIAQEVESLSVLVDPALGARRISDLVDLPRLRVMVAADPDAHDSLRDSLERLGVAAQVGFCSERPAQSDVLVADTRSLEGPEQVKALSCGAILLIDPAQLMDTRHGWLEAAGFTKILSRPWLYARPGQAPW